MFVLKAILSERAYQHFMLFSIASRILSSEDLWDKYLDQAEDYLERFVLLSALLYGEESPVMNMHSLIHLADDRRMGCSLSDISAFPFESKLGRMKKNVHGGNKGLEQLCQRMGIDLLVNKKPEAVPPVCKVLKSKKLSSKVNIDRIKYHDCELTTKAPNNIILTKSGEVIKIEEMYSLSNTNNPKSVYILGQKLEICSNEAFT